ncbi:MAG: hypothetical protein MZU97_14405 [Bacillus subtilis]|nr:hypothetical protein [Bacillus subtilis]
MVAFGGVFAVFLVVDRRVGRRRQSDAAPDAVADARGVRARFRPSATLALMRSAATALRLVVAMGVAAAVGLGTEIAAGLVPDVYRFLRPVVTVLRTVPVISIVVIVLIVFGFESTPYAITFLMVFPILFQACRRRHPPRSTPNSSTYFKLEDGTLWGGLRHCYLPLPCRRHPHRAVAGGRTRREGARDGGVSRRRRRAPSGTPCISRRSDSISASVFAWTALLVLMAACDRSRASAMPVRSRKASRTSPISERHGHERYGSDRLGHLGTSKRRPPAGDGRHRPWHAPAAFVKNVRSISVKRAQVE